MVCTMGRLSRRQTGSVFFFNDPAPPESYTRSLHDALPTCLPTANIGDARQRLGLVDSGIRAMWPGAAVVGRAHCLLDRKSTRLNSSHANISYAVFCLKKKYRYGNASPTSMVATRPLCSSRR